MLVDKYQQHYHQIFLFIPQRPKVLLFYHSLPKIMFQIVGKTAALTICITHGLSNSNRSSCLIRAVRWLARWTTKRVTTRRLVLSHSPFFVYPAIPCLSLGAPTKMPGRPSIGKQARPTSRSDGQLQFRARGGPACEMSPDARCTAQEDIN